MSRKTKRAIRLWFRAACFRRDRWRCVACGFESSPLKAGEELDAHHITDRKEMPGGGYVEENGVTLCKPCHELAESFHALGVARPGYTPRELYARVGSSYELALRKSLLTQ